LVVVVLVVLVVLILVAVVLIPLLILKLLMVADIVDILVVHGVWLTLVDVVVVPRRIHIKGTLLLHLMDKYKVIQVVVDLLVDIIIVVAAVVLEMAAKWLVQVLVVMVDQENHL
tara:strand:- start:466 stop:807 length:342 start_codon:yes stop_codon:yes gene_type:complete